MQSFKVYYEGWLSSAARTAANVAKGVVFAPLLANQALGAAGRWMSNVAENPIEKLFKTKYKEAARNYGITGDQIHFSGRMYYIEDFAKQSSGLGIIKLGNVVKTGKPDRNTGRKIKIEL